MRDGEFIRGDVPMTKEEVRSVVIGKLELKSDDILMDVGAGTGSVTIEAAMHLKQGRVIAIEQKDEAIALIYENIKKHGLSNIEVLHKQAPEGMESLEKVNKFFIGGSGGNLDKILQLISDKAQNNSIIVVTAIVLETMMQAYRFFKENNYSFELIQVSVNKVNMEAKPSMLLAQNPIFILTAKKRIND